MEVSFSISTCSDFDELKQAEIKEMGLILLSATPV